MLVRDIMTEEPVAVQVHETIGDVLEITRDLDIRHVPVLEDGRLVGMISDRDLRDYSYPIEALADNPAIATDRREERVSVLMTGRPMTVGPGDNVVELIDLMLDQRVGAVPVVDPGDGALIGVVSYIDVLHAAREYFEDEL